MAILSSQKILRGNNANDPSSITSLTLTHRALSDVSCLSEFKNLEKLDLSFNNLTSLEGLKSCVNLKWLSVVQNKLVSLKGMEGLTQLTVFNAGKNKLKSMDEIKSLARLRALILNDNEINTVCKLDQMKDLNTLVLSRNPITSLGESLAKLKSITKLSLSNCQLRTVSLKSCSELKEIRLAHNEIMTVPSEFALLVKLQNLDMGNNLITYWSDLKVLSSLINLKILNLQGNPVAEKKDLAKKVKKLLPNLRIFNARPIDKVSSKELYDEPDSTVEAENEIKLDHASRKKKSKKGHSLSDTDDSHIKNTGIVTKHKRKERDEKSAEPGGNTTISEKKKKMLKLYENNISITEDALDGAKHNKKKTADSMENGTVLEKRGKKLKLQQNDDKKDGSDGPNANADYEVKQSKRKKEKKDQFRKEKGYDTKSDTPTTGKEPEKKSQKTLIKDDLNAVIDSAEAPFADLFASGTSEIPLDAADLTLDRRNDRAIDAISGLVTLPSKKKKKKSRAVDPAALELSRVDEIGLGGPSAW